VLGEKAVLKSSISITFVLFLYHGPSGGLLGGGNPLALAMLLKFPVKASGQKLFLRGK